ncbi:MAG: Ig-like domain-containing protein, partial [Pseudomonadota bacterium]
TLVLNGDGSYTYTPDAGFTGTDSFTYVVTDAASGESSTETVSITVTVAGVNNPPTDITLSNSTVSENQPGAIIGTLTTIDPDGSDTHIYTVSDARFEVNALGELKLRAGASLDFETEPSVSIQITTQDVGGLTYSEIFTITVIDVAEGPAPTAPTVNVLITNDSTPVVTGTATVAVGQSLSVTVNGVVYVETDPQLTLVSNSWTLFIDTPLSDGIYNVVASVSDGAGGIATDGTTGELVIDTQAPTAPTVSTLLTNDATPVISGTATVSASDTFTVSVDGEIYTEGDGALSLVGNAWTLSIPDGNDLNDGTYNVIATVTDSVGNPSSDATTAELIVDLTPPSAPTVVAQLTPDTTPAITGTVDADPGDEFSVSINGAVYVEGDGNLTVSGSTWTLVIPEAELLTVGTYEVVASLTDLAGNVSIDVTSNELTVASLAAPPTVVSQATNDNTPIIRGTFDSTNAEGGFSVTVNGQSYVLGESAALTAVGDNWVLNLSSAAPLDDGVYEVRATSIDRFGLPASDISSAELVVDSTPPETPTVDALTTRDTTPTVQGSATVGAGETLTVTLNGVTYVEGDGNLALTGSRWTLTVPEALDDGRYEVLATVTDAVANVSTDISELELTVDSTAPLLLDQELSYQENSIAGVNLVRIQSSDVSGVISTGFLWQDGSVRAQTEDGYFSVDSLGNISLTASGAGGDANDFEVGENAYEYTVVATDALDQSSSARVTLSLLNIDDVIPVPDPGTPPPGGDGGSGSNGAGGDGDGNGSTDAGQPGQAGSGAGGDSDGSTGADGYTPVDFNYSDPVDPGGTLNQLDDRVRLQINPEDRPVQAEGITQLTLPSGTFTHDDPFADISVIALMSDGSSLPDYISFDPNTQSFSVDGEAASDAGVSQVEVQLIATDDQGQTATGTFRIDILDEPASDTVVEQSDDADASSDSREVAAAQSGNTQTEQGIDDPAESAQSVQSETQESSVAQTADQLVRLTVNLENQRVLAEGGATIALPANTFEHSNPGEELFVEATLIDGSALPAYVIFDAEAMTFVVDGAAASAAGETEITVVVVGRDAAGNSASGVFVIEVESLEELIAESEDDAPSVSDSDETLPSSNPLDLEAGETQEPVLDESQAEAQEAASEDQRQAKIRENLDSQLEKASRYTFVDKIEQLLDDIKNLFT